MSKTFKVGSAAIGASFFLAGVALVLPGTASAHTDDTPLAGAKVAAWARPATNNVADWCPDGGVKYEPVSTPFVVPPSPSGYTWTLLVLKAASGDGANATFPNPVVGQGYSHPSGHDNSHAILCWTLNTTTTTTTTTTESTTTTTEPTTTTTESTTTTTESTTTTTEPTSTTPSSSTDATTSAPTTQPSVGVSSTRGAKVVGRPLATLGVPLGQIPETEGALPATGSTVGPTIAVASMFVAAGAAALLAGRRHSAAR